MMIRLYNQYELVIVFYICLSAAENDHQCFHVMSSCQSLLVLLCGGICMSPPYGIICPSPIVLVRDFRDSSNQQWWTRKQQGQQWWHMVVFTIMTVSTMVVEVISVLHLHQGWWRKWHWQWKQLKWLMLKSRKLFSCAKMIFFPVIYYTYLSWHTVLLDLTLFHSDTAQHASCLCNCEDEYVGTMLTKFTHQLKYWWHKSACCHYATNIASLAIKWSTAK